MLLFKRYLRFINKSTEKQGLTDAIIMAKQKNNQIDYNTIDL